MDFPLVSEKAMPNPSPNSTFSSFQASECICENLVYAQRNVNFTFYLLSYSYYFIKTHILQLKLNIFLSTTEGKGDQIRVT